MNVRVMCQDHGAVCPCMCHEAVSLQPMVSASRSDTRHTPKTGEMRNMKPNPFAEHWKQCGSSNLSLVPLRISPRDGLAMVPRSLGLLSAAFFSLLARANPRQRRQGDQYR